jgi:hypothetical protein
MTVFIGLFVAFLFDRFVLKRPWTAMNWPIYVALLALGATAVWMLPT